MRRSTRRSSLKSGSPVLTESSVLPPVKPTAMSKSSTGKSRKKPQRASPSVPASEAISDAQTIAERLEPKAKDEPYTKAAEKEADLTSKKKNTNLKNAVVLSDQRDEDSNDAAGSDDACTRTASEDEERLEVGTVESEGTETALVTPRLPSSAPSRRRQGLRPTVC
jgi:hypothetical protein